MNRLRRIGKIATAIVGILGMLTGGASPAVAQVWEWDEPATIAANVFGLPTDCADGLFNLRAQYTADDVRAFYNASPCIGVRPTNQYYAGLRTNADTSRAILGHLYSQIAVETQTQATCRADLGAHILENATDRNTFVRETAKSFGRVRSRLADLARQLANWTRIKQRQRDADLGVANAYSSRVPGTIGPAERERAAARAEGNPGPEIQRLSQEITKLMTSVPMGAEPEMTAVFLDIDRELGPNTGVNFDNLNQRDYAWFEAKLGQAVAKNANRYREAAEYVRERMNPTSGFRSLASFDPDERFKRDIAENRSVNDFTNGINIAPDLRSRLQCDVNGTYRDAFQRANITAVVVGIVATIASFGTLLIPEAAVGAAVGTAAVVGRTALAALPAITAADTLLLTHSINEARRACGASNAILSASGTGRSCDVRQAFQGVVLEASTSRCAVAVATTALGGVGAAAGIRQLSRARAAGEAVEGGARAAGQADESIDTVADAEDVIVVTAPRRGSRSRASASSGDVPRLAAPDPARAEAQIRSVARSLEDERRAATRLARERVRPDQANTIPGRNERLDAALARDYVGVVNDGRRFESVEDFESAASAIHDVNMRLGAVSRETNPGFFVPFNELSAADKLREVDALATTLRRTNPDVVRSASFRRYRARLAQESAVAGRSDGSVVYVRPNEQAAVAPAGSRVTTAENDRGLIIETPSSAPGGATEVRLMEPKPGYPEGYGRIRDSAGYRDEAGNLVGRRDPGGHLEIRPAGTNLPPAYMSNSTREMVTTSLRGKGITESNYESFFNSARPVNLEDGERVFLFERYSNLNLSRADGEELLRLHRIGNGIGTYSRAELRAKAEGIRAILRRNGITDSDEISRIINLTMRNGVTGRTADAERTGVMAWLRERFGAADASASRPSSTTAIPTTDRPYVRIANPPRPVGQRVTEALGGGAPGRARAADRALDRQLAGARENYRNTGREVVDSESAGSRAALARRIGASDTFGGQGTFRGSMDDLVQTRTYANEGMYESLGGYNRWWEKTSFSGQQSFSPIRQAADRAEPGVTYERNVFWQRDQLEANKQRTLSYQTAFERFGVAENVVVRNGRREVESVEVLARREDGTIEPLYYVREGDRLVLSRTFKGEPVERACVKCHHNPAGNTQVLTQLPYATLRTRGVEGLAQPYQTPARRIAQAEGIRPPVASGEAPPSAAAVAAQNSTASFARNRNGSITDLDQQREAIEIVTSRAVSGPYRAAVNRVSDVQLRGSLSVEQKAVERYNLLRYGKSTDEVAAFRSANGGSNPPTVFSEAEIAGIRDANILGEVRAPAAAAPAARAPTEAPPRAQPAEAPAPPPAPAAPPRTAPPEPRAASDAAVDPAAAPAPAVAGAPRITPRAPPMDAELPDAARPGARRSAAAPSNTRTLGTTLQRNDRFVFYNNDAGRQPLGPTTLTPGKTYTTIERKGKIVIGEDIRGDGARSNSGTHIELNRRVASELPITPTEYLRDPNLRGGSIRVNSDGSVDVSGYHNVGKSDEQNQLAADNLAAALREAGVRVRVVTPDRLPAAGQ